MAGWKLERTMSVGDVVAIVTMLAALALAAARGERRLAILETKLDPLWQQYQQFRATPAATVRDVEPAR